ncbi:hypothetical protein GCM10010988_36850 [Cnuibacter physcomitrellae]|uniref:Uncharacterized protein n=1 Tax=Cnuibacter physcomitrellae TaxID=1619308 RepID=A0A1X9LS59_9MICO|nr:hypothetical protein [Cnuibacter physcomitrellae]ARJ04740.1 hypothetical protein B5808_05510 [Cnuibacter physcomitrellae]GGI42001.1 hypothetical protein GCM10010988_36850 [Cnuibacter physcomitrellae]
MARIRDTWTVFRRRATLFYAGRTLTGSIVLLVETDAALLVFDDQGAQHRARVAGSRHQVRRQRAAAGATRTQRSSVSVTDVLRQEVLPMS